MPSPFSGIDPFIEGQIWEDFHHGFIELMREALPPADYYAFVCRADSRPSALVFPWSLRQPLPVISIPLGGEDADVPLDLQSAFTALYDRAGYDYSLDYTLPVSPPLPAVDVA